MNSRLRGDGKPVGKSFSLFACAETKEQKKDKAKYSHFAPVLF